MAADIVIQVRCLWAILACCLLCGGCARYEFDLTRPPELARHIGAKSDEVFDRGPLEYRLIAYDNRLVVRIFNKIDQPIELLGAQSVVVDPAGQSHPLPRLTIAPDSFIKLIFPPIRPEIYPTGPSINFGISSQVGRGFDPFYHYRRTSVDPLYDDPFYNEPRYFAVYDPGDALFWNWNGQTEVRLMLVYQHGETILRDEFVLKKVKL